MKHGRNRSGGFTIVETMIVLAVTTLLLMSSLSLVANRQAKVRFQIDANRLQGEIQQIINESEEGYYPNNDNFSCDATPGHVTVGSGSNARGTNKGCVLLGKIIEFAPGDAYDVYPVAGYQMDPVNGGVATTVAISKPTVAESLNQQTSYNGITIGALKASDSMSVNSFGFLAGNADGDIASKNGVALNSGSEQFSLYALSNLASSIPVSSYAAATHARHVDWVSVCMTGGSGGSVKSALITVRDSGGMDVTVQFKGSSDCS